MRKRDVIAELLDALREERRLREQERAAHREEVAALMSRIAAVPILPFSNGGNAAKSVPVPDLLFDEEGLEAVPRPSQEK